jgi:hypothetical protein
VGEPIFEVSQNDHRSLPPELPDWSHPPMHVMAAAEGKCRRLMRAQAKTSVPLRRKDWFTYVVGSGGDKAEVRWGQAK